MGPVPRIKTDLGLRDHLGSLRARMGVTRNRYKINPGLYAVNSPGQDSPVFVTANYKLSFDTLRRELTGIDGWILVVDTRGVNVWCAAGKGTFSDDEIALQVNRVGLARVVSHRELILPQFGATGVASHELRKKCGFRGIYGPLQASDIPAFLQNGRKADEAMRAVTFTLPERLVLVPVELFVPWKVFSLVTLLVFTLSGLGPGIFSLEAAWTRGLTGAGATVVAVLSGTLLTPALLPWIPGRQFWLKGFLVGALTGLVYFLTVMAGMGMVEKAGIWLWTVAIASYTAMNFTGATPYTSLSGVEKEMKKGLPVQIGCTIFGLLFWIAGSFTG